MNSVIDISTAKQNCRSCAQATLCLPDGMKPDTQIVARARSEFSSGVKRDQVLRRGDAVFRQGDEFDSVYVVRSGAVKVLTVTTDGEEQVLAFCLPGDLLGLDAIDTGVHQCSALALDTVGVCKLPFSKLEQLSSTAVGVHQQMGRIYGREIARDFASLRLLGSRSAERRLAGFLLSLSERLARRGFSRSEFNLSMSRNDIANHLGLAAETVSRLFAKLQEEHILGVERRRIALKDLGRLRRLAGHAEPLNHTLSLSA